MTVQPDMSITHGIVSNIPTVPMTPDTFREIVKNKKFTNGADCEVVAKLYEGLFNRIAGTYTDMFLENNILSDATHTHSPNILHSANSHKKQICSSVKTHS
eukprot:GDKI01006508.1.p3 GENE.GDKI01006508.1~~GDKI01006508.1.p3  ORF type:complete len:101 (+),score=23.18 GDKI01006508.1:801-1103(+)